MIVDQAQQHIAVPVRVEDAFDDDIEASVESEASRDVDESSCVSVKIVASAKYVSAQYVLTYYRNTSVGARCAYGGSD